MEKTSQIKDFPFLTEKPVVVEPLQEKPIDFEDMEVEEEFIPEDIVLETVDEELPLEEPVVEEFKLETIPGMDGEDDFIEEEPEEVVVEETKEPLDPWGWESLGLENFLDWVKDRLSNVPKHSGKDISGIERAIGYLERVKAEFPKALRKDHDRKIDAGKAEDMRLEIADGINRLDERAKILTSKKFKKNKKAFAETYIVKEADTSRGIGSMTISVPYLVSNIARACINSMVSAGKDIEDIFNKMAKDYSLDKRERFQVATLIKEMGYPMILDRVNFDKSEIKPSENLVSEFSLQYYS